MQQYVILRRSGWRSPAELEEAAGRSARVGDEEMSDDIRWIRSYVLAEDGGSVGTVCADEIIPIADTVIVRPDPQPARA